MNVWINIKRFKTSPYVNDEVNRLVNACLSNTQIGQDAAPEFADIVIFMQEIMITNPIRSMQWKYRTCMSVWITVLEICWI